MLKELVLESQKNDNNQIFATSSGHKTWDSLKKMDQHGNKNKKRPVRLLPNSILYAEKNVSSNNNQIRRFYGPPTNCSQLAQLGYTLNGYYLVKSGNIPDIFQVDAVYCSFKQPGGSFSLSGLEKRLGHYKLGHDIGTANGGVHFYAILRSFNNTAAGAIIQFDQVTLNMGEAFDLDTGYFTAPRDGVYQFFFAGVIASTSNIGMNYVVLYRNKNELVMYSLRRETNMVPQARDPVIQATLKLKQGETIHLKANLSPKASLLATSFSGSLLESW